MLRLLLAISELTEIDLVDIDHITIQLERSMGYTLFYLRNRNYTKCPYMLTHGGQWIPSSSLGTTP